MSDTSRAWLWKMLLEVVLIGVAVFLGMAADQWRSDRQHQQQARAALQSFRKEIQDNKAAVEKVRDYHVRIRQDIIAYLDPKTRAKSNLAMQGILPATLEQTAWDVALATQALADIDKPIAFELTGIYSAQRTYNDLSKGLTQAMYLRPPGENLDAFLQSVKVYYDDIVIHEPDLLARYNRILPMIDSALRD